MPMLQLFPMLQLKCTPFAGSEGYLVDLELAITHQSTQMCRRVVDPVMSAVAQIPVFCNGLRGIFLLGRQRIVCLCADCADKPEQGRIFSCTQFEMHCGAGAAKKWKASLRIEPGGVPEVKAGESLPRPGDRECAGHHDNKSWAFWVLVVKKGYAMCP